MRTLLVRTNRTRAVLISWIPEKGFDLLPFLFSSVSLGLLFSTVGSIVIVFGWGFNRYRFRMRGISFLFSDKGDIVIAFGWGGYSCRFRMGGLRADEREVRVDILLWGISFCFRS